MNHLKYGTIAVGAPNSPARIKAERQDAIDKIYKDKFCLGYFTAALWSSTDDCDLALDNNYSIEDIDISTMHRMIDDCLAFQSANEAILNEAYQHEDYRRICDSTEDQTAGHDFWLTRNGHGAGFWDGDYPKEHGDKLTAASKQFGEFNLYIGDDNKIHGN